MPPLKIRQFPDSILRKMSIPVQAHDRSIKTIVDRLIETMRSQPGGIGIAAPQVGILKRVAIVDVSPKVAGAELLILINPVILRSHDDQILREGCMSLPDFTANVRRAQYLVVHYNDLDFKNCEKKSAGVEARCIQHEIDHLNGMLFVDRVSSLKSDVFQRKRYL